MERNGNGVPGKGKALVGERTSSEASETRTKGRGEGCGACEDDIKRLEHELGRYQKKVKDQTEEIERLRKLLYQADAGNRETQTLMDAILTAVALEHGERATDPDAPEKELGWRLTIPKFSVRELRQRYELHARKDGEKGVYVLGVMERKGAEHDAE